MSDPACDDNESDHPVIEEFLRIDGNKCFMEIVNLTHREFIAYYNLLADEI